MKNFYNYKCFQYYKMPDYLDILPYACLSLDSGFISIGWLIFNLSCFFKFIKVNNIRKYFTLINRKAYLICHFTDWYTPRILICNDAITICFACFDLEIDY